MTERKTFTGTVKCSRLRPFRRARRGGVDLGSLLMDAISPLPPLETWYIVVPDPFARKGEMIYRLRSGRRPKAIDPSLEGQEVTMRASIEPWHNGLGGYMLAVKVMDS